MTTPDESGPQKPCLVCGLFIPAAAKVCTHCDRAQNPWIRGITRLSMVGAALAALIPLANGAWSLRTIAMGQHRADIRVRAVACGPDGVTVAVMNFGRGPAVVTKPGFSVDGPHAGDASKISLRMDSEAKIIAASEVQNVTLTGWLGKLSTDLPRTTSPGSCTFRTTLTVEDVDSVSQREAQCSCPGI
jgi:predicted nucleic acid-binding Zn ribbon protein